VPITIILTVIHASSLNRDGHEVYWGQIC